MQQLTANPTPIPFDRWAALAGRLEGLTPEEREDEIERAGIDPVAFAEAEEHHLRAIGRATSRGDLTLAKQVAEAFRLAQAGRAGAAVLSDIASEALAHAETQDGEGDAPGALPFGRAPSPAFLAELRAVRDEVGPASDAGRTLDPAPRATDDTLPFAPQRAVDLLQIETYARYRAELEGGADRASLERAFGIDDPERRDGLERYWQRRLASEGWLRSKLELLVERHKREKGR